MHYRGQWVGTEGIALELFEKDIEELVDQALAMEMPDVASSLRQAKVGVVSKRASTR